MLAGSPSPSETNLTNDALPVDPGVDAVDTVCASTESERVQSNEALVTVTVAYEEAASPIRDQF